MTDIAELGLKVDSSDVKRATTDLAQFAGASSKAQAASTQLAGVAQKTGVSLGVIESMAKRAGISTEAMTARIEKASAAVKSASNNLGAPGAPAATAGLSLAAARMFTSYNSISLALQAVTAAASAYFAYMGTAGPTVEKTFEEQDRLLRVVKDSYDRVTQSAKRWLDQSKDVTMLQLTQQQIDLQSKLQEAVGKGISGATTRGNIGDVFLGQKQIKENLLPFEDALFRLQDGFKQGTPNVRAFVDEVARLTLITPALQKVGADLVASFGDSSKLENARKQVEVLMKAVRGEKLSDDETARADLPGRPRGRSDPFESQVTSINKHIAAMKADAEAVDATAGQHARLRTEAQLYEAAQQKGGVATAAQVARLKELGQAAADAAMFLAKANVDSQIKFGRNTAFLTPEDLQIAQQLKSIYPDVATALGSVEAAGLRTNSAISQLSGTFQSGVSTALGDIITRTNSASDAFRNLGLTVVRALTDMVVKFTIVTPLAQAFQASLGGSGVGGLLGGLFGGAGGTASVATGLGAPFPMFAAANGGTFGPGWGVVGERGPELIKVHNAGVTVIPNHISKPYLPGFAEGGMLSKDGKVTHLPVGQDNNGGGTISIVQHNDFRGADPSMKGWIKAQIKVAQDQTLKAAPGYTARVSRDNPNMRR